MEHRWHNHYYDLLEFYYTEPRNLNPLKFGAEKGFKFPKAKKRLQGLEVPLNHIITYFFLLAPNALCKALFGELFGGPFSADLVLQGRNVDTQFRLDNSMQPDFVFLSETDVVSIEMKLSAKCCVDQILKYALLGLAVELDKGHTEQHHLAILGSEPFCKWKERFKSIEEVDDAVRRADREKFLRKQPKHFHAHQEQFNGIVENLCLKYWTYHRLSQSLADAMPSEEDHSAGAEVYRKLLCGLLTEFEIRGLYQPICTTSVGQRS